MNENALDRANGQEKRVTTSRLAKLDKSLEADLDRISIIESIKLEQDKLGEEKKAKTGEHMCSPIQHCVSRVCDK